jgi:Tfp pilus assembly protein PilO
MDLQQDISFDDLKTNAKPYEKAIVAIVVVALIWVLYLTFYKSPTQQKNKINQNKINQISSLNDCVSDLTSGITKADSNLELSKSEHKKLTSLFHTGKELDDLYRHISELALNNKLMISKINKSGDTPIFENEIKAKNTLLRMPYSCEGLDSANSQSSDSDEQYFDDNYSDESGEQVKVKKVAYYNLEVQFEITGDYMNYTNFRKDLAKLDKIININQENIVLLESKTKAGEVKAQATLAIYRLPVNESEKYIKEGQEDLL